MSNAAKTRRSLSTKEWLLLITGLMVAVMVGVVLFTIADTRTRADVPDVHIVENEILVSEACMSSMHTAAGVEALNNDVELIATLSSCTTTDEWIRALQANPDAAGLTSVGIKDGEQFLSLACVKAPETAVCADAKAAGRLS